MITLASKITEQVGATDIHFVGNILYISLNDGREISIAINQVDWLNWLAKATPEQRAKWSLEPGGFAVYWDELDNGIEVCHIIRNATNCLTSRCLCQDKSETLWSECKLTKLVIVA